MEEGKGRYERGVPLPNRRDGLDPLFPVPSTLHHSEVFLRVQELVSGGTQDNPRKVLRVLHSDTSTAV